ncbi:hypothetical protein [Paraliomyxa miuraensis]|uniref:hypothetical protein n=1 Tax=Paraliomyxa miuraensis TaxID=376150 RepID=UPI0022531AFB|nr:hypothetical protein [Paraliomyxa miuraensis]MCX4247663.1 hypothetical protein [Paraliomyxa miuraensis]
MRSCGSFDAGAKVGGLLVLLPALACASPNPAYGLDDDGAATEDTSGSGSASATTAQDPTSSADGSVPTSGADGTTTGAPPTDSSPTGDEPDSTSGETTAAGPVAHVFHAYLGDCVHPPMPNPDACTAITDPGYIQVDGEEPDLGGEVAGFIAFEISGELAGAEVLSVLLRLTAHPFDPGSPTGVVWQVEPFTHDSLFEEAPEPLGGGPVGPAPSTVPESLLVEVELDPAVIVPGQPLFLGIFTASGDGVDYLDEESASPPTLVVTVQ